METLTMTAKISEDGKLTLAVPAHLKGATVEVTCRVQEDRTVPRDANGWPEGYWDSVIGSIKDPNFKRYPQGEPDPLPSFE